MNDKELFKLWNDTFGSECMSFADFKRAFELGSIFKKERCLDIIFTKINAIREVNSEGGVVDRTAQTAICWLNNIADKIKDIK